MKIKLIFISFLAIFFSLANNVFASYEEAKGNYQLEYSKYRQLLQDYKVARSEYITYKTLASRTQAITKTKDFLIQRQQLLIGYLEMITRRLSELEGPYITTENITPLTKDATQQSTWLKERIPEIANASELEDLVKISSTIDGRIAQISSLSYQSQAVIINGRAKEIHARANDILAITSEQVRRISSEGKKDTNLIQRWLIDAEQKSKLATNTQIEAEKNLSRITNSKELEKFRVELSKSKQYINETNNLLLEITRNIKVK